jgi:poly(A) polymerase
MEQQSFTLDHVLSYWFHSFPKPVKNLFVVGGVVRDRLLGLPGGDVDLVCEDALSVAEEAAAQKGAALIAFTKKKDSPCYRLVERKDPALSIDISPLKRGDIFSDLAARDFTVNAMALEVAEDLQPGKLVDPFDGSGDLEHRRLKMTTPEAFQSDPLRIFRAFRFAATLGFTIESGTLADASRCSGLLKETAGERILTELRIFLRETFVSSLAGEMVATGAVRALFPGRIERQKETVLGGGRDGGVLARVEGYLENPEDIFGGFAPLATEILHQADRRFLVKAAALFLDSLGVFTAETAEAAAGRLHMPRKMGESLRQLASGYHFLSAREKPRRTDGGTIEWYRRIADETIGAAILAMASAEAGNLSNSHRVGIKSAAGRYLSAWRESFSRPSLVSGKDLVSFGMPAGPVVGEVLKHVRNAQDLGKVSTREDAMRLAWEVYLREFQ